MTHLGNFSVLVPALGTALGIGVDSDVLAAGLGSYIGVGTCGGGRTQSV
jgi:hypothetical protein